MLFAVFATVSQLSMLSGYSYALDYGWNTPKKAASASTLPAVCSVQSSERGFPILYERQAPGTKTPSGSSGACRTTENPLAKRMDMALCFAAAAIIGAGAAGAVRSRQ
jgi:hypothetical protein